MSYTYPVRRLRAVETRGGCIVHGIFLRQDPQYGVRLIGTTLRNSQEPLRHYSRDHVAGIFGSCVRLKSDSHYPNAACRIHLKYGAAAVSRINGRANLDGEM